MSMISLDELVSQILDVCLSVKAGENIWIHGWDHTVDLASQIAFACRQRGAHPLITISTENYWLRSLIEMPKSLLAILPPHYVAALEESNVFIFLLGPRHPVDWGKIPEEKRELATIWFLESNEYADAWRKICSKNRVRMLGVEYCTVTPERAGALGVDYDRWQEVMLAGCLADQKQISETVKRLAKLLQRESEVEIRTAYGTNLHFKLAIRPPNVGDSIVTEEDAAKGMPKFLPSGFVEIAADEDSAEGIVVYDVAVPIRGGKRVKGLKLRFEHGRVVDYSAESNVEVFDDYLKSGKGDIAKFAFVGFGINPSLKHGFTQDDKVLGGVTVGVGGNEDKGGKNRTENNSHWWASMTKATVKMDGRIILADRKVVF